MKQIQAGSELKIDAGVNILLLIFILIAVFPLRDAVMGDRLRWIALHAGMTQGVLFLLGINALAAILSFFPRFRYFSAAVRTTMVSSTFFWLVNYLFMLWVTRITWGGFDWQEPRMETSTQLLFILLPYCALNLLINYDWLMKYTTAAMGIFSQFLIRTAGVVNHPEDPVGMAGDAELSIRFASLSVLFSLFFVYNSLMLHGYVERRKGGRHA